MPQVLELADVVVRRNARNIVDHVDWHVLFWMMLPFAVVDLAVAWFILRNVTEQTHPRLDIASIVLS